MRNNPAPCAQCGITQPLIGLDSGGQAICGPCSGTDVRYICRTCGEGGRQYADGQCGRCVLQQRVEDLLTSGDGTVHPQLGPVLEALVKVEYPISILGWLRKSESVTLLRELAQASKPITHQMLDQLPPSRHLYYVRDVLMHTGVLEERSCTYPGGRWLPVPGLAPPPRGPSTGGQERLRQHNISNR